MYRHLYGENAKKTDLASTPNNLGLVDSALGDYNAARANYEKALETQRHVYGENAKNTNLASTQSNVGLVDSALGNYNAAHMYYEKSTQDEEAHLLR
jgi:tetratricopeptide (TPR) repeat protein